MFDFDKILSKYEGKGIPYRGRCDDINTIVKIFSVHLPEHNERINNNLINDLFRYKYIHDIKINGNDCIIKYDEGEISFCNVPECIKSKFGIHFYDVFLKKYCFAGQSHAVTLKYLQLNHTENICAVTSICVDMHNILFFHSYIWDKDSNKVIDFSRNIIMDKHDYDLLFCYKEINVLSYSDLLSFEANSKHFHNNKKYYKLLFFAFIKLLSEDLELDQINYSEKKI